jgi:hypothetical protein
MNELSGTVQTRLEHDNTAWIGLEDLDPDSKYYYRLMVNGKPAGQVGRFRTLPSAAAVRNTEYNPKGRFNFRPRECEIRWSSYSLGDIPRDNRRFPIYCVVQVNNVFNNPRKPGETRWVAFPKPHVIFQYYDGWTGELRYAETIQASR